MELDKNQEQIAFDFEGNISVIAWPGSGKTRTLIERTNNMVKSGIFPHSILLITYTNKARAEIKNRLRNTNPDLESVYVHTFHSFGIYILRLYGDYVKVGKNFNVIDDEDIKSLFNKIYKELGISKSEFPLKNTIDKVKSVYAEKKQKYPNSLDFVNYLNKITKSNGNGIINTLFKYFVYYKRQNNCLDFDDILIYTNALLTRNEPLKIIQGIHYLMVDEAQDLNFTQYEFIVLFKAKGLSNILLVGDFDQNIYSWRGARVDLFLNFYNGSKTYKLDTNYRSTKNIVKYSKKLIDNNKNRIPINLISNREEGAKPQVLSFNTNNDETYWVASKIKELLSNREKASEIAIFYRANYLSRSIESALVSKGIQYIIYNGADFYSRMEIKDTIALLKLLENFNDKLALERLLLNTPGIGPITASKILETDYNDLIPKHKQLIDSFKNLFNQALTLPTISAKVTYLIDSLNFKEKWDDGNLSDRLENYSELLRYISTFDDENLSLEEFLDNISLLAKRDEHRNIDNCIKLMTLHSSKGLEFKYVFIISALDNILPSFRSVQEGLLEEERRLMYVGMTRSKEFLWITYSPIYGYNDSYTEPSRFLKESDLLRSYSQKTSTLNVVNINNNHNATPNISNNITSHYSFNKTVNSNNQSTEDYLSSNLIEFILTFFLGFSGAHHFYKNKNELGLIYLFTFGIFGLGWMFDIFIFLFKCVNSNTNNVNNYTSSTIPKEDTYNPVNNTNNTQSNIAQTPNCEQNKNTFNYSYISSDIPIDIINKQALILAPQFLKQAKESVNLINTTYKPETFFERYLFYISLLNKLIICSKKVKFSDTQPQTAKSQLISKEHQSVELFINRYYFNYKEKIANLKTEKAKNNKKEEFLKNIRPYLQYIDSSNTQLINSLYNKL